MAKKSDKGKEQESESAVVAPSSFGGLGDYTPESLVAAAEKDAPKGTATADAIRDAMGNVRPTLETVKIKGHGANLFQFADESKVDGDAGLTGVIVAHSRHNSYFGKPFDQQEKGEMPPCFSNDGETLPENVESPVATVCSQCPKNRDARKRASRDAAFETLKEDGPVKVCNNYLSIALALPGKDIPVRVRFTRQSFKSWAAYVQQIGTEGRYLPHEVATEIKLENMKGQKAEFSVAKFRYIGALPAEVREAMESQRENYRALLQRTAEADEGEDATDDAKQAVADARKRAEAAEKGNAAL